MKQTALSVLVVLLVLTSIPIVGVEEASVYVCEEAQPPRVVSNVGEVKEAEKHEVSEASNDAVSITVLEDSAYYYMMLELIENANRSIYVVMYAMRLDLEDPYDPVNVLAEALIGAEARGVSVSVLLENDVKSNIAAYDYLKANNVSVAFDSRYETTHSKFIVLDEEIAVVGSHNWTEYGLWSNHEVSVLIEDTTTAAQLIWNFKIIWGLSHD